MNFFTFDVRKVFLAIVVIVVPLLAVNMQRKSEEELWFTKPFTWSAGLVQKAYSSFSSGVRGTTAMYVDLINIKVQNRELQRENAELRAQLGSMTELKMENERLSKLLGFKQSANMELLAGRVIGRDLIADHHTIWIDRGTDHGVKKNMATITTGGVVGYIYRTEPTTSQILLLTDRYAVIDAIVQRSRARGFVEGYAKDQARLRYLKRSDDVQVGDLIVTSGLNNIFPKGFQIGTVTSIDKSRYGMTQDVEIKPVVEAMNLEEVFIVLNSNPEPIKESGL
jgi:rod shape-determining protein MreC